MNRRTACQLTATGLLAGLAGCAGFEAPQNEQSTEATEDDESTETETPEPDDHNEEPMTDHDIDETEDELDVIDSDRVAGASFSRTDDCSESETARVDFPDSGAEVVITGCIQAHNGCAEPILAAGSDEDGTLRIDISQADVSDDDTFCTQAVVDRGYKLELRFDSELPETIEVFHDGATESGVVATASRP